MPITESVKRDVQLRSQQISGRIAYLDREIADLQSVMSKLQSERTSLILLKSEYESSIPSPAIDPKEVSTLDSEAKDPK
ncbi:MAG: hypothetical protein WC455_25255 [Dehalococcoidia bacterium]|jgi:hypothetical protein